MTNTAESHELRTAALQPRAQATVAAIREAALQHYNEVGRDKFNTSEVAKLSGKSIGTIYRYYPNRIGLMNDIAPERDVEAPVGAPGVLEVEVVKEVVPEDVASRLASAETTLKELRTWAERLADKGAGQGDLQIAGKALVNIMADKGW